MKNIQGSLADTMKKLSTQSKFTIKQLKDDQEYEEFLQRVKILSGKQDIGLAKDALIIFI